jgi:dUTP pyrophosphatase
MHINHADTVARQKQLEYERIARAVSRLPVPVQHLKVQKLSPHAKLPARSNSTDAGWDLHSLDSHTLKPGERRVLDTGIALEIPAGYVGLIWPRSGLAIKQGVDVFAGVVDSGYRGEIKVCLYNSSIAKVSIRKGDRISQILFQQIGDFNLVEAVYLEETPRGDSGFGSTGK